MAINLLTFRVRRVNSELIVDLPTADFFAEEGGLAVPRIRQFLSKLKKD